ncbi:MAG: hypothetical protein ACUVWK_01285 [Nitrososphaerales archaeon]
MSAVEPPADLMVAEWHGSGRVIINAITAGDDSETNPDYKLLPFHWYTTANYWINPNNRYGFSVTAVVTAITASADTWDAETNATVFSYQGIPAGVLEDGIVTML